MRTVGWTVVIVLFTYLASGKREKTNNFGRFWLFIGFKLMLFYLKNKKNKQLNCQRSALHRPSTRTPPWRRTAAERFSTQETRFIIAAQKISLRPKGPELFSVYTDNGLNWLSSAKVSKCGTNDEQFNNFYIVLYKSLDKNFHLKSFLNDTKLISCLLPSSGHRLYLRCLHLDWTSNKMYFTIIF